MKYYLLEPFAKDLSVEKNPPLSEKGIRMARVFALNDEKVFQLIIVILILL